VIEALIAAVERAVLIAQSQFFASMRDLSLEDYICIQQLSLKEDGQPFGDYLLWLFAADLSRRVFENEDVEQKQRSVDELLMIDLPPRQLNPSADLAEMYKSALFRKMAPEVKSHPLSDAEHDYPLLGLGDIFISDKLELYMVLNPECDLAYSPASEGRVFSTKKSIVLIPGTLHPLHKSLPQDLAGKSRTEFFVHEGQTYRIVWDTKRTITREYGQMREWITSQKMRREYRLRLLYALEVQHDYTAEFGRIGPPIAPPIFNPVRLELFGYDENGKSNLILGPLDDDAALVTSRGSTKCALDFGFLENFCAMIPTLRVNIEKRIGKLQDLIDGKPETAAVVLAAASVEGAETTVASKPGLDEEQKVKLAKRIERFKANLSALNEFEADIPKQIELISTPFATPEPGSSSAVISPKGLFHIYHDKEVQGKFQAEEAFILRLSSIG
jgi:hypothetical protein